MPRVIIRDGVLHPTEPLPPGWEDGQEIEIYRQDVSPNGDLGTWFTELKRMGVTQYDPGEQDLIESAMREADEQAKSSVRKQMGSFE